MRKIVLLCVLLAGCSGKSEPEAKSDPAGKERPAPKEQLAEPVAKLSAVHFFNEYNDNPIKADELYKGKTIQLTGEVGSISSDSIGMYKVDGSRELTTAEYARLSDREKKIFNYGYEPNVVCKIDPAHKAGFAEAKKDKPFALIGRVVGESKDPEAYQGKVVILEMCRPAK